MRCKVEVGVRCIGWGGSVRLMTAGWVHCCGGTVGGRLCWAGWCIGWGGSMVVLCGSMRFYGGSMVVLCGVRWGGSVRCEVEVGVRCIGWGGSVRLMTAGWVHCCCCCCHCLCYCQHLLWWRQWGCTADCYCHSLCCCVHCMGLTTYCMGLTAYSLQILWRSCRGGACAGLGGALGGVDLCGVRWGRSVLCEVGWV